MKPASAGTAQRLSPSERLKRRAEFAAVFEDGRRTSGRYVTVLMRPNQLQRARLGIVASKKLGGAVVRNRAKRLIRNIFRLNKSAPGALGYDVVVIPRRELLEAAFSAVEADYQAILSRRSRGSR